MAVDLRQVFGAFLTFSMFVMLGNMVKRDHIDPLWDSSTGEVKAVQAPPDHVVRRELSVNGPWKKQDDDDQHKPCWKHDSTADSEVKDQSNNGYIFFTLTHGPEFHASQVANAVTVAKHLRAKLALPKIRGTKSGGERRFEEIYDVNNFIETLKGIVQVDKNPPSEYSSKRLTVVRVPERVSNGYILASNIERVFLIRRNLKIITDFNSSRNYRKDVIISSKSPPNNEPQCVAIFESLKLQPKLQETVDSMMSTMRGLSRKTSGRFIAVDLRVEMLTKKSCQQHGLRKRCFNAREIAQFLKKIGFYPETAIYLTQRRWDKSLNSLRISFPTTFTKDAIMPAEKQAMYLNSDAHEYEKYIDFYMCTKSDVFVPAFSSRFYASVVGKRIGERRTLIFFPSMDGSDSADDYISPYIAKKAHPAYSCFC